MRDQVKRKLTIGFISTWPIYQGTTIDRYAHSLIQGISAAANEQGCNLLLGCGFSITGNDPQNPSFWPVPGPNINFVPVGPWNTDGLIVIAPRQASDDLSHYLDQVMTTGHPIVFVEGAERRQFHVKRVPFTIGRRVDKDLVLAESRCSRDHAIITADNLLNLWSSISSKLFAVLIGIVSISLVVGANTITTIVHASDGIATKAYTVTVTRAASSNADLSNLVLSAGTLALDYSTNNTSKLSDTGMLALAGGSVSLVGGSHVEIVGSTTIAAGGVLGPLLMLTGLSRVSGLAAAPRVAKPNEKRFIFNTLFTF